MKAKKVYFIIGGIAIVGMGAFLWNYSLNNSVGEKVKDTYNTDQAEVNEQVEKYTGEMKELQDDRDKAETFILNMLINEDSLVDLHLDHVHEGDSEEPLSNREQTIVQFISALTTNDVSLLEGVFETDALTSAFSEDFNDYTPEGLNNEYERILSELTKDGEFLGVTAYTFTGETTGVLKLNYQDGSYEVPFSMNEYEEGHGNGEYYYTISTPIQNILENIN